MDQNLVLQMQIIETNQRNISDNQIKNYFNLTNIIGGGLIKYSLKQNNLLGWISSKKFYLGKKKSVLQTVNG